MFVVRLKQDHFSDSTIKLLGPTPPFLYLKKVIFSDIMSKNDPLRHLQWLLSERRMHRLPENMSKLSLKQDHFSN